MNKLCIYSDREDWKIMFDDVLFLNLKNYPLLNINQILKIRTDFNLSNIEEKTILFPLFENDMLNLYQKDLSRFTCCMPKHMDIIIFRTKNFFYEYCKAHDLTFYIPNTYSNINDLQNSNAEKFIIKPTVAEYGNNTFIRDKIDINDSSFHNNVIQEYIPNNKEYVAHIVAKQGKIQCCIVYCYYYDESYHIKGGQFKPKTITKITLEQKYIDQMEKFLIYVKYTGACNFDFLLPDGQLKVMEINPRLGGSLLHNKKDLAEIMYNTVMVYM